MGNISSKDTTYDAVIDINNLSQLTTGWKVTVCSDSDFKWNGCVIGVMGLFNKGKTFVLNRLTNSAFIEGDTAESMTKGLSFKFHNGEHRRHIVLDSAGLHRAVPLRSFACQAGSDESRQQVENSMNELFDDIRQTEEFLHGMILSLSDYIILVVGNLTRPDQEFLNKILRERQSSNRGFKEIFVVHNLREVQSEEDLNSIWKDLCQLYAGETQREPVRKTYVEYFQGQDVRHVIIGNDKFLFNRNSLVFDVLNKWIEAIVKNPSIDASEAVPPLDIIASLALPLLQNNFINDLSSITFDQKKGCFRGVPVEGKQLSLKIRSVDKTMELKVGTYLPTKRVLLKSVDPVQKLEDELVLLSKREAQLRELLEEKKKKKKEEGVKEFFVIEMEVPGVTPSDVKLKKDRSTAADCFRIVVKGNKTKSTCDRDFQVQLDNRVHGPFNEFFDIPNAYDQSKRPLLNVRDGLIEVLIPKLAEEDNWDDDDSGEKEREKEK